LKKIKILLGALAMFIVVGGTSRPVIAAQLNSNTQAIALSYGQAESITVSVSSNAANFTGTTPTTSPISVTTAWSLAATRTTVGSVYWLSSASAALTDGNGDNIPSSSVQLKMNSGAYSNCTQPMVSGVGVPGATCNSGWVNTLGAAGTFASQRIDTITLQLVSLPSIPAASYSGTLNVAAYAN
jgi:hypothetical protein